MKTKDEATTEWRQLPAQDQRVETGAVRFGNDCAGVFIRGDMAFYYRMYLESIRPTLTNGSLNWFAITDLIELLASADEHNMLNPKGEA